MIYLYWKHRTGKNLFGIPPVLGGMADSWIASGALWLCWVALGRPEVLP